MSWLKTAVFTTTDPRHDCTSNVNWDEAIEIYNEATNRAKELRKSERRGLAALTMKYCGQPIGRVASELNKLGFKVYVNMSGEPPLTENSVMLDADQDGKLIRFHSVFYGIEAAQ